MKRDLKWCSRLSVNGYLPVIAVVCVLAAFGTCNARADTFGSGANQFSIDFVTIGNPGNPPDTAGDPNPAGSVPYVYRMGKYEISEQMIDKANALGGLWITKDTRGPDKPATSISWYDAARFVDWLNTSTGHLPAYKFDATNNFQLWTPTDPGYDATNLYRNTLAKYFLPSDNEWYKAAYYDPVAGHYWQYPTGSNDAPVPVASGTDPGTAVYQQDGPADVTLAGGPSPYGTVAQGGNVDEWEETALDLINDSPGELRGARGGSWIHTITTLDYSSSFRNQDLPFREPNNGGFRVARTAPEPAGLILIVVGGVGLASLLLKTRTSSVKGGYRT
jgi:hypothetical protein